MKSRALSQHIRDQNEAERDWRRSEAERIRQAEAVVPPITPSHAEIIATFKARQAKASLPAHVEGARYRVRFRYLSDRMRQVRHFASPEDRDRYIDLIKDGAEVIDVWEAA